MPILKLMRIGFGLVRGGPLVQDGWIRSVLEQASVDREGRPIPWITYSALDFLSSHLDRVQNVFEWGCGNGTLWWAEKADLIRAVEHDPVWLDKIRGKAPGNVELIRQDLHDGYEDALLDGDIDYDVIVIDGRRRLNCMELAPQRLSDRGVIILDNSDREQYQPGIAALRAKGFNQVDFSGFCPIVNFKSQTSIFYRQNNLVGL